MSYLETKAKEFADYNASKSDVRDYLIDSGLSDFEADETLHIAFGKSASENRLFACKQMFGGGGLALLGGVGCFTPAMFYAGALVIAGLGVFAIGVYSFVTGKT